MTVPAAATRLTPVSATADARGLAAVSTAFVIWGVLPLYLKQLQHVPALQITAHRLVWGCLFGMLLLGVRGELTRVHSAFADPRVRWRLCASAALVSVNWLTYVWAIGNHRVVESSLGYFINPLLNVVLGVVVLSEGLGRVQWAAVAIAAAGVLWLTRSAGHPPWIAVALALTFGLYGSRSQDGSGGCPAGVRRRNAAPPAYDTRPTPTF
jgi:chloramphenicol-sensitive protein RarD